MIFVATHDKNFPFDNNLLRLFFKVAFFRCYELELGGIFFVKISCPSTVIRSFIISFYYF